MTITFNHVKKATTEIIAKAPANTWPLSINTAAEPFNWFDGKDADCSRDEWLGILLTACAQGVTKVQAQSWSATGATFDKTDFDAAWAGALKKLAQSKEQSISATPTPAQEAASASLEQKFSAWPDAPPKHDYLAKKKLPHYRIKIEPSAGRLAVPIRELDGTFRSIQFIDADGKKMNAIGVSLGSGSFVVGKIEPDGTAYVCEGLATAWAVHDADPYAAAVVSFSAGRFGVVAKALHAAYPLVQIVLVPDRGAEARATEVATMVQGFWVALPSDMPSNADAWDYWHEHGKDKLKLLLDDLHAPEAQPDHDDTVDLSDTGNAMLFTQLTNGDLRYVFERRSWLHWDGLRWTDDVDSGVAQKHALRVAQYYRHKADTQRAEAANAPPATRKKLERAADDWESWSSQCRNKHRLVALQDIASKFQGVSISVKALDTNPMLLGVQNGVVDLNTGELRPAAREEFVTKCSPLPFDPTATCPKWLAFIEQITAAPIPAKVDAIGKVLPETIGLFKPRPALADYLQRMLGYTATGRIEQHKMFVLVGAGANGKSVLVDVIRWVLGDYAATMPSAMLLESKADTAESASPSTARLAGARLALASENREGQKFAAATVKRLTGGDTLVARFLHSNPFEFAPTHKLVLQTNSIPALDHLDPAIRGRLHLVPFDRRWNRPGEPDADPLLPNGNEHLVDDLRAEGPGILAWLVRGAVAYFKDSLVPPTEVANMTGSYFTEQDVLGKWLARYERVDPKGGTAANVLLEAFLSWCADEGIDGSRFTKNSFSSCLVARQVKKHPLNKGVFYGLRLKDDVPYAQPQPDLPEDLDYLGKL